MNRKQLPVRPRRHSLPVPSLMPTPAAVGPSRVFPEGTDTFQKALEDLYISDLSQPFVHHKKDGLQEIEEGDEEEYSSDDSGESEREVLKYTRTPESTPPLPSVTQTGRRHSLPAVLLNQATDKDLENYPLLRKARKKSAKTLLNDHSKYMRDYFIKHGHWPSAAQTHNQGSRLVPSQNNYKKTSPRQAVNSSLSPSRKLPSSKT